MIPDTVYQEANLFDTGIQSLVNAHLLVKAAEIRDYGEYWPASSAGYCNRKVMFDRLHIPHSAQNARQQAVFSAGHVFHEWMQRLTREASITLAQELELQDEELMVRGHIDDLIQLGDRPILYDYKTVNSRSFHYSKDQPMSYYHKMQLGTYMYLLREYARKEGSRIGRNNQVIPLWLDENCQQVAALGEARILKISKDDLAMEEQQLIWGDTLHTEITLYWSNLNQYWKEYKEYQTFPPCTCADQENGFMAKEKWNPYYYNGEPCSLKWYTKNHD